MIGVIADDLTGAAELSGVGLRYGLRAEVVTELQSRSDSELICVDTDSRAGLPAEAGRRAAEAAGKLAASRAHWIYKKADSVLRGHILVELEAMMNQLGLKRALLVPANPSLERVVRNGQYFVRGKPIHQTDFRLDPEYPRYTSSVGELLGASGARSVHVCGTDDPLPLRGIIIGEAETTDDLRHWASRRDGATLMAGAAEFFATLLEASGLPRANLCPRWDKDLHFALHGSGARFLKSWKLSMNRNWERRHLCVAVPGQKLAGKDAGAPSVIASRTARACHALNSLAARPAASRFANCISEYLREKITPWAPAFSAAAVAA